MVPGFIRVLASPWIASLSSPRNFPLWLLGFSVYVRPPKFASKCSARWSPERLAYTCSLSQLVNLNLRSNNMHKVTVVGSRRDLEEARRVVGSLSRNNVTWKSVSMSYEIGSGQPSEGESGISDKVVMFSLPLIQQHFVGRTMSRLRVLVKASKNYKKLFEILDSSEIT